MNAHSATTASADQMTHDSGESAYTLAAGADAEIVGEAALTFLTQLRSAVVELFRTVGEMQPEDCGSASEFLRRAGAMLETTERQASPAVPMTGRQGLAPWQVRRVLAHIDTNLDKPIRNKELADIARRSEFHFNVAFRKSVGDSPHEYIIRRRMERAQGLMLSTDAPLSEIAIECGLADQAHFTRLFRRVVGETPAAWRRARANPPR